MTHKRRIVFTLLYGEGMFWLSRNFRLQSVGDVDWLERNYAFDRIAAAIDELVMLDVTRTGPDRSGLLDALSRVTRQCFIPVTAGGWVRTAADAQELLAGGADKVLVNTPVLDDEPLIRELAGLHGAQCVVAGVDVARDDVDGYAVHVESGNRRVPGSARQHLARISTLPIGDLYLNSIDRDGTGQGYDLAVLSHLPDDITVPVVLAGGAGNASHLAAGLADPRVDAVATAHLLNFVGDGLALARRKLIDADINLPLRSADLRELRDAAQS